VIPETSWLDYTAMGKHEALPSPRALFNSSSTIKKNGKHGGKRISTGFYKNLRTANTGCEG
jgi:hypothetical protein